MKRSRHVGGEYESPAALSRSDNGGLKKGLKNVTRQTVTPSENKGSPGIVRPRMATRVSPGLARARCWFPVNLNDVRKMQSIFVPDFDLDSLRRFNKPSARNRNDVARFFLSHHHHPRSFETLGPVPPCSRTPNRLLMDAHCKFTLILDHRCRRLWVSARSHMRSKKKLGLNLHSSINKALAASPSGP